MASHTRPALPSLLLLIVLTAPAYLFAAAEPQAQGDIPPATTLAGTPVQSDTPAPAAEAGTPVQGDLTASDAKAVTPAESSTGDIAPSAWETRTKTEADSRVAYPALTIEIPDNPLVKRYMDQYTSPEGLKYLSAVMKRSSLYRDFIRSELRRNDMPEWLLYLPVIESGFSTGAVSRSGATGIWQFMRNSVGGYGIHINEWLDERRDPWIATTAAVRKLADNYRDLGDWNLALAAYNCGLGATRRAVKKGGRADYWYLSQKGFFKRETMHYVPKFLAISHILSRSDEFGIDWGQSPIQDPLITIPVRRPVDLAVLAKETGTDTSFLRSINPSLHYSITPPDSSYNLRIPEPISDSVQAVLNDRTKMLLEYYMYKIKSGDTLYALSLHYGVSVDMIQQYNPGLKPSTLQIGKKIVIPAIREVSAYKGKQDSGNLDFSGVYLVKKGDTLWSIALAYNVQVETLAERNNIEVNSVLKLGKQLRVPIL